MEHKEPYISIILPVYNGENTLKATLDSLLNQTFTNFEVLIGIDGTKDGSKTIAESFGDKRIKIFENPKNLGLGPNLNAIIKHAHPSSKYFAMAEQDDYYVPERLQWQIVVLDEKEDVGLVSGIVEYKSKDGSFFFPGILIDKKQFPKGEELFLLLYKYQLKVVNTCMMWRKSVHEEHNLKFTDKYPNMNIDWDFIMRFSLVSNIYGIHEVLVVMSRDANNDSVTRNKSLQHETTRRLLMDFRDEFPNIVKDSDYKRALKVHRKVELGHHTKLNIFFYGIYYFILYQDFYFIKYIFMRIKRFMKF
ncbi:glycosyltransferase family 2 protein [Psychroserpens luteolus]|uniref:glycosyltransferase family 2 protein n=1 Tax=Psychroserpens luteolus TaxID=2855840 RepID=UPI001E5BD3B6|nr:glycosyltransferase family 2 protein [Psychroserpens luteolus]MCD2259802.1 glycosyltransferase [Psychroserpens luteolus]